jgi:hypothetical protein
MNDAGKWKRQQLRSQCPSTGSVPPVHPLHQDHHHHPQHLGRHEGPESANTSSCTAAARSAVPQPCRCFENRDLCPSVLVPRETLPWLRSEEPRMHSTTTPPAAVTISDGTRPIHSAMRSTASLISPPAVHITWPSKSAHRRHPCIRGVDARQATRLPAFSERARRRTRPGSGLDLLCITKHKEVRSTPT